MSPSVGAARHTVAALCLAVYLWGALLLASGLGSVADVGLDRLREHAGLLLLGSCVGLYGMSAYLLLTRRRRRSPWLILGLAPVGFAALNHVGFIQ